ncbi:MAG: ethylbenzene dehydrogenase-related protein [Acidimicrobiia bacterium]
MLKSFRSPRRSSITVVAVVALALVGGVFGLIPVKSQAPRLEATPASAPVLEDDPWSAVWDGANSRQVSLSAQELVPPFGGGAVGSLTVRALHADFRLFLLLEWADDEVDDAVNGSTLFADAAAVQFPSVEGSNPPYTMGSTDLPVSIWQWKAVWQKDIDDGFASSPYPNTAVDTYPGADEAIFNPAQNVGNPLASSDHPSPVESLVAEGFGTLTPASAQDVAGVGHWRDGKWRALFARDFETTADGPSFAVDQTTLVAFAVWDGAEGDRNGQKSIAQFIELDITDEAAASLPVPRPGVDGGFWGTALLVAVALAVLLLLAAATGVVWIILREVARR